MKFETYNIDEERIKVDLTKKECQSLLYFLNAAIEEKTDILERIRLENLTWNRHLVDLGVLRKAVRDFLGVADE